MKIRDIAVHMCDAGWRPWVFVRMETDLGLVGWSEITDSNGSPRGMAGVVEDLKPRLLGKDPRAWARVEADLQMATRQSPGGIVQKAIAGCVNAMLDIVGKQYGMPVAALFGGPLRDSFPVYWSHFGTTRVRAHEVTGTERLRSFDQYRELARIASSRGFSVVKSNILRLERSSQKEDRERPSVYMPGFGRTRGGPECGYDEYLLEDLTTLAECASGPVQLIIDLNFNLRAEGLAAAVRALEERSLYALELDCYNPLVLKEIRSIATMPIVSGENLYTLRQYEPFLSKRAMDIASIDLLWNGFPESLAIAKMADLHEITVSPHNFNSALGDAIASHFAAVVPNLRMCEYDVDDVPWKHTLVRSEHRVERGQMHFSSAPGWGVTVDEAVFKEHPWPKGG